MEQMKKDEQPMKHAKKAGEEQNHFKGGVNLNSEKGLSWPPSSIIACLAFDSKLQFHSTLRVHHAHHVNICINHCSFHLHQKMSKRFPHYIYNVLHEPDSGWLNESNNSDHIKALKRTFQPCYSPGT